MAPSPLRVAVLGCWHVHAGDYARSAVAHPDTTLVAAYDRDPDLAGPLAAELGVEATGDLDALLAREDVDAVTVTTETTAHTDVIGRALAAGKHVFTEKLLAPTVAECEALVAQAADAGLALVVSLPRLSHGYALAVRDVLAAGTLGRLTYARVRLSHDGAVHGRDRAQGGGWLPERFYDPATAVGGALTDLGCHPVYLTQLFLGETPQTVRAVYASVTGRAVEDHAVVSLGYEDGGIGVVEAGFVSNDAFTIDVHGTEGSLHHTQDGGRLVLRRPDGGVEDVAVPADAPDPFSQWVTHAGDGTQAVENLHRAVELTRLVERSNAAAQEGGVR
ncbi:Gfo/Idh/MocA family protein [Kineococcus rubinsiae]|uniref:Gfo/Idh/MocA family protein n=1 Tax=Kineococcus rubinsiae TaxID=2609562 RepID=UPI0027E40560|nr:Gfo/Idh/MocA family oxidoreductase [Kineococcus rubinsiae]NIZ91856.1 Gfo/Idh/MocA family oxidoreductase [Kineococcus rubinsiae]